MLKLENIIEGKDGHLASMNRLSTKGCKGYTGSVWFEGYGKPQRRV